MKKWLTLAAALAAVGILSRLPHPSRDIARLEPVRAVYLCREGAQLRMETDTGDSGTGQSLTEALERMKAAADGEIFLETAEFLILGPGISIGPDFYELLRPDCRVCFTEQKPDLPATAKYLSLHTPKTTLAQLRAQTP